VAIINQIQAPALGPGRLVGQGGIAGIGVEGKSRAIINEDACVRILADRGEVTRQAILSGF
jgi:hypothetical protein